MSPRRTLPSARESHEARASPAQATGVGDCFESLPSRDRLTGPPSAASRGVSGCLVGFGSVRCPSSPARSPRLQWLIARSSKPVPTDCTSVVGRAQGARRRARHAETILFSYGSASSSGPQRVGAPAAVGPPQGFGLSDGERVRCWNERLLVALSRRERRFVRARCGSQQAADDLSRCRARLGAVVACETDHSQRVAAAISVRAWQPCRKVARVRSRSRLWRNEQSGKTGIQFGRPGSAHYCWHGDALRGTRPGDRVSKLR
jgi:hypothetical protein